MTTLLFFLGSGLSAGLLVLWFLGVLSKKHYVFYNVLGEVSGRLDIGLGLVCHALQ